VDNILISSETCHGKNTMIYCAYCDRTLTVSNEDAREAYTKINVFRRKHEHNEHVDSLDKKEKLQ